MTENTYDHGFFCKRPRLYAFICKFLHPIRTIATKKIGEDKLRIIDIATGTGCQAIEMAKRGHQVTGIDLDPATLEIAKQKCPPNAQVSFRQGDGTSLEFKDKEFDATTICFAMHHLSYDQRIKVLEEAKRVISPEGFIMVVDYNHIGKSITATLLYPIARLYESRHYASFVKNTLDDYIEDLGLRIVQRSTLLGIFQFVKLQPI